MGGIVTLVSMVTGGLWGLIGGAILGASQAKAPVNVVVNQGSHLDEAKEG